MSSTSVSLEYSRRQPVYAHPSIQQPQLPNELLSVVVAQALLSPRLTNTTDQLFIQPKCKIAFESLCNGFGVACRRFRAILFREWFRALNVQELNDLEEAGSENGKRMTTVRITGFIREVYFHQPLYLQPFHFHPLWNLQAISYPLNSNYNCAVSLSTQSTEDGTGAFDSVDSWEKTRPLHPFPKTLQRIELRDSRTCSPEELRFAGISRFTDLRSLRVNCGDDGAWGPVHKGSSSIPQDFFQHHFLNNNDSLSSSFGQSQTPNQLHAQSQSQSMVDLAQRYLSVLSPMSRLTHLSLDVHLSDNNRFAEGHQQADPPVVGAALHNPFNWNNLAHLANINPLNNANNINFNFGNIGNTNEDTRCTLNNFCARCWDVRRSGSQAREAMMAKLLAKGLRRLKIVEWTIWFREKGKGEERRRIEIERSSVIPTEILPPALEAVSSASSASGLAVPHGESAFNQATSSSFNSDSTLTSISNAVPEASFNPAFTPTSNGHLTPLARSVPSDQLHQSVNEAIAPTAGHLDFFGEEYSMITGFDEPAIQGGGDEHAVDQLLDISAIDTSDTEHQANETDVAGEQSISIETGGIAELEGNNVNPTISSVYLDPADVGDGDEDEDEDEIDAVNEDDEDGTQTMLSSVGDVDGTNYMDDFDTIEAIRAIETQLVDDSDEGIHCTCGRVPYAMYPAVLG